MEWSLDDLAFIARWVIWPLLQPFEQSLQEVRREIQNVAGSFGPGFPSNLPRPLFVQQINASSGGSGPGAMSYLAENGDGAAPLLDAKLLYRARGGEILRKALLSQSDALRATWEVQIQVGSSGRTSTANFATPIDLLLPSSGQSVTELPNQVLGPGDCLFAWFVQAPTGEVDGPRMNLTLEIEGSDPYV